MGTIYVATQVYYYSLDFLSSTTLFFGLGSTAGTRCWMDTTNNNITTFSTTSRSDFEYSTKAYPGNSAFMVSTSTAAMFSIWKTSDGLDERTLDCSSLGTEIDYSLFIPGITYSIIALSEVKVAAINYQETPITSG